MTKIAQYCDTRQKFKGTVFHSQFANEHYPVQLHSTSTTVQYEQDFEVCM
jgi:hypothetical protein